MPSSENSRRRQKISQKISTEAKSRTISAINALIVRHTHVWSARFLSALFLFGAIYGAISALYTKNGMIKTCNSRHGSVGFFYLLAINEINALLSRRYNLPH